MQAMLLAAGLGTRLRPYSYIRPKPLFPVLNRPLLVILLDMLVQAGCSRIVVNSHHLAGQVELAIAGRTGVFSQFEPEILGTGGSLRQALPLFADEPVLVVNGDIFHAIDLKALYAQHLRSGCRITLAMHDYARFNTVQVRDGRIRTFRPDSSAAKGLRLAFTGIHVVDPAVIERIPQGVFFHVIDLYEELAGTGEHIGSVRVDGSFWRDIGTVQDYLGLHGELLTGCIPEPLPVARPKEPWLVHGEASIGPEVQLSGWGCVGKAVIGRNARLHNCVVWDRAVVPDGACMENRIIPPEQAG